METIIDKKEEKDIIQFLNEFRQEMAKKGLTPAILENILKDEGLSTDFFTIKSEVLQKL